MRGARIMRVRRAKRQRPMGSLGSMVVPGKMLHKGRLFLMLCWLGLCAAMIGCTQTLGTHRRETVCAKESPASTAPTVKSDLWAVHPVSAEVVVSDSAERRLNPIPLRRRPRRGNPQANPPRSRSHRRNNPLQFRSRRPAKPLLFRERQQTNRPRLLDRPQEPERPGPRWCRCRSARPLHNRRGRQDRWRRGRPIPDL